MKKTIVIMMLMAAAVTVTACGTNGAGEPAAAAQEAAAEEGSEQEPLEETADEENADEMAADTELSEEEEGKGDYISDIPFIMIEEKNYDVKDEEHYLLEYRTADISALSAVEDYSALAKSLEEYSSDLQPAQEDIDSYKAEAESDLEYREEEFNDPDIPIISVTSDYSPARVDTQLVSLKVHDYVYLGGAHGESAFGGVTFDTRNGKKLSAQDIFSDYEGFEENMKATFKESIPMLVEPDMLNEDWQDTVDDIDLGNGNWYFDSTGFTYVFNDYEIAPYVQGATFISIGYEQLTPFMKSEYIPDAGDRIAAISMGNAGCASLVKGIYVSVYNDSDEEDYLKSSGSVTIGADTKKITDSGYIEEAYLMNRCDRAYLFLSYVTMSSDDQGMVNYRNNLMVMDVTDGDMNSIYEESDVHLEGASLDMDTFRVSIGDEDNKRTEDRVMSLVLGE